MQEQPRQRNCARQPLARHPPETACSAFPAALRCSFSARIASATVAVVAQARRTRCSSCRRRCLRRIPAAPAPLSWAQCSISSRISSLVSSSSSASTSAASSGAISSTMSAAVSGLQRFQNARLNVRDRPRSARRPRLRCRYFRRSPRDPRAQLLDDVGQVGRMHVFQQPVRNVQPQAPLRIGLQNVAEFPANGMRRDPAPAIAGPSAAAARPAPGGGKCCAGRYRRPAPTGLSPSFS